MDGARPTGWAPLTPTSFPRHADRPTPVSGIWSTAVEVWFRSLLGLGWVGVRPVGRSVIVEVRAAHTPLRCLEDA